MTQIATLLIAMTFTGGPVASAFCVSWCHWSPVPTCDMSSGETVFTGMAIDTDTYGAVLSDTPFVHEKGWTTSQPTSNVQFHSPGGPVVAPRSRIRIAIDAHRVAGQPVLALVLRV
jgi:hypothetical protein